MTNQIGDGVMDRFQQRVTERLQSDLGDLVPQEVLAAMVQRAVEEAFFKPTKVRNPKAGNYGQPDFIESPSWFASQVSEAARPLVDAEVKKQVQDSKTLIADAVGRLLDPKSLPLLVATIVTSEMSSMVSSFGNLLNEQVRKSRGY